MEARAEGIPPATANCYSAGLRVRITPRAGLLQASRPADAGEVNATGIFMHFPRFWHAMTHCLTCRVGEAACTQQIEGHTWGTFGLDCHQVLNHIPSYSICCRQL